MIEVTYESIRETTVDGLLTNLAETDRILDFVGAERRPLVTSYHRQRLVPYGRVIRNFDRVERFIRERRPEWLTYFEQLEE